MAAAAMARWTPCKRSPPSNPRGKVAYQWLFCIRPAPTISQGRNAAFAHAGCEILAFTDAGVRLPADWLSEITAPLLEDETLDVASGFFYAAPESAFEAALGAATLPLLH